MNDLHRVAATLEVLPRRGLIQVARDLKQTARAIGGPMAIGRRGRGRRTVRLRAVDTIRGDGPQVNLRLQGVPVGPWVWQTSGTRPHLIGVRPHRGRKQTRLELGDEWVTGPVRHRGSGGRGRWRRVQTVARDVVADTFRREVARAVRG